MKTFTARDIGKGTGEPIGDAEAGRLSLATRHGTPVFVAVPFDEALLQTGLGVVLAIHMFNGEHISLSRAAHMANRTPSEMIDLLGRHGIPVIRTTSLDLAQALADFS